MNELVIAVLGFLGAAIPLIIWWLKRRPGDADAWKSQITYWVGRPRSIGSHFFGRESELKAIVAAFKDGQSVVLSGGTGVGKSQLATEFVQKSKRKGFWTPGGETPAQTLISLAPHLGIEREERSDDELLRHTRARLQALPAKTLWVIDNLSDPDQLNTLLNETGKTSLLVTTQDRRENVVDGAEFQQVGVLDPGKAVRLLCRGGRHDPNQPVFLDIVEAVGCLPRAVEALAVQLDSTGETPERLLEELLAAPNALQLDRFQKQTPGLTIPRNESLFNALRGPVAALPPNIREALAPLGYTADLPIPKPLVKALTGLNRGDLINFFDECEGKSVLSAANDQVTLHSLTAAVIVATNLDGSLQTALGRAHTRLGAINETRNLVPAEEMSHYENMRFWVSLALDQEEDDDEEYEVIWAFSNNLANAFESAGRFEEAVALHRENLEFMEWVLAEEDPDTLTCRNNLANAHIRCGRFEEAARLHQENLDAMERVLGPEHPTTLANRSNLANAHGSAGRFDEAARLHQEILEVRQRVLEPEHPDIMASRNNLANAHDSAGRFEEAARLHQENLEVVERVWGSEHPNTLNSRNNLAVAFGNAGCFEEAARLHKEILEVRQQVLGPEHPVTFTSRHNLASAYAGAGRFEEAARLHQENLEARQRVLGPENPDTQRSRSNLAVTYRALGRDADADALLDHD